jgi:hypothetical protein
MHGAIFWLAIIQAVYFLITGVWPIVHLRSFMAVTGPKVDYWLVKTVGVLVAVIALVMGMAAVRGEGRISVEIFTLAVAGAAALGAVDVIYVVKRVIPKIYLVDAVAEAILIAAWLVLWR